MKGCSFRFPETYTVISQSSQSRNVHTLKRLMTLHRSFLSILPLLENRSAFARRGRRTLVMAMPFTCILLYLC